MKWSARLLLAFGAAACSSSGTTATTLPGADAGADAPANVAIGTPCTPSQERNAAFLGFQEREVSIEENSPACGGGLCLVNHFRGRVSCTYGQDASGNPPLGASSPCWVTGGGDGQVKVAGAVPAQCTDRRAAQTVLCSCRCANADGKTDDGATYCACPSGTTCTGLVERVGGANDRLAGAYCIANGTAFDAASACATSCDPNVASCP